MTKTRFAFVWALVLLAGIPAHAQEADSAADPARWETSHSIVIEGETVEYDAVVAGTTLTSDSGDPAAELWYTAYFRTNGAPSRQRPVVFSYNGGPGSASFWLHMGIMGPRRVVTPDVGPQGAPPYPLEDNAYTILDIADIVMVDPIGTGFSHLLGDTPGSDYWGIDEDARSLTQFIRRFLSEYDRWNAPRYLLGESYGTTRSAVLASHLQRANIDLNGIVLVSSVLQFNTIQFAPGDDLPYIVNLPSYAITARYLDALPGENPPDLEGFMAEVEEWSLTEYATALLAGATLDPDTRARVIDQMHRYTGLSHDYIDKSDLRVTAPAFEAELLRDQGRIVGRLDARFTGPAGDLLGGRPSHDPQSTAISSAYTSATSAAISRWSTRWRGAPRPPCWPCGRSCSWGSALRRPATTGSRRFWRGWWCWARRPSGRGGIGAPTCGPPCGRTHADRASHSSWPFSSRCTRPWTAPR